MKTDHIDKSFDEELAKLDNMVAEMGGLAEVQLTDAINALLRRDVDLAGRVVERDWRIDALENDLHAFAIGLLALRQPMADDLWIIVAALNISSNLEQIGGYAKNIAKRTFTLAKGQQSGGMTQSIARMAALVQVMIKNVLDACIQHDAAKADDVRARHQEVDQAYNSLLREFLVHMVENPHDIEATAHLAFVAKNVERIGDHLTGIAEQVHFMVAGNLPGELLGDLRSKDDNSSHAIIEPTLAATEIASGTERLGI